MRNVQSKTLFFTIEDGAAAEGAQKYDPFLPPSYNVATTLPSYEEAERTKEEEEERRQQQLAEQGPVSKSIDTMGNI